jgi:carboxylesterase
MADHSLGVLILHGFTSSLDCVSSLAPPMEALGLPTRLPILRGHCAETPDALRGVRWQDWVADAEAALNDLLTEAERVVIVGLSMGVLVAVNLAADHPQVVDSVVFVAPTVQLASPLAPGRPFGFLVPVLKRVMKRWNLPPRRADPALVQFDTNYPWAPMEAIAEFLAFSKQARDRLPEVRVPTLVIQSRGDTTVAPESAEIVLSGIGTPPDEKRIIWFERTEHEIFRDVEAEAAIAAVVGWVSERVAVWASSCEGEEEDQRIVEWA